MEAANFNDVPRWRAVVTYRSEAGPVEVTHDFEELDELDTLVERGPHWETIEHIVVVLARHLEAEGLTLEAAEAL